MNTEQAFIGAMLAGVVRETYAPDDELRINPLSTSVGYFNDRYYEMPKRFLEDPGLQTIWDAIVYLKKKRQPIDMITVATRIGEKGGVGDGYGMVTTEFIAEVINEAGVEGNIGAYYKDIFDKYCLGRIKAANRMKDVHKLLDMAKKYEIEESDTSEAFERMAQLRIGSVFEMERNHLSWTIPSVDRDMGRPVVGMFHVLAGEGGIGKSFLTTKMGLQMSEHAGVIYFCLEMAKESFLRNYVRTGLGKTPRDIEMNNFTKEDVAKGNAEARKIEDSALVFIDEPGMAEQQMDVNIENIIKITDEQGANVAIIDSMSVLCEGDDKTQKEAAVAKRIKEWVDARNKANNPVTIILLHHLRGDNSGMAGSTKIGHYAGLTIIMKHEDKENGVILWETGKVREHSYCKQSLIRDQGGLVEYGFT